MSSCRLSIRHLENKLNLCKNSLLPYSKGISAFHVLFMVKESLKNIFVAFIPEILTWTTNGWSIAKKKTWNYCGSWIKPSRAQAWHRPGTIYPLTNILNCSERSCLKKEAACLDATGKLYRGDYYRSHTTIMSEINCVENEEKLCQRPNWRPRRQCDVLVKTGKRSTEISE